MAEDIPLVAGIGGVARLPRVSDSGSTTSANGQVLPVEGYVAAPAVGSAAGGGLRAQDSRPEGVVFVFDGGVLDEADVVGMVFPDAEIVSAAFHTLAEVSGKVKVLLADRLRIALEAVAQGVTVLCER